MVPDGHDSGPPVDVVEGQIGDLPDAQSQVAHTTHHGQVAASGRRADVEVREGRLEVALRQGSRQAILGPLGGSRDDSREGGIETVAECQKSEEAAQRGRQDSDRAGLQMTGVASEVILEIGRPKAVGVQWGVAKVSLQELTGVPQSVDARVAG